MSVAAARSVGELIRAARALVFDFDGTLVDSNEIKWQAFETCFAEFAAERDEILAYCRSYHHVPRGEKFRHVYETILGRPYTAEVAAMLHARFASVTTHAIVRAAEIPGAGAFTAAVAGRTVTGLLSSTPHEVLLSIVGARGWKERFSVVRGAPVVKAAWLRQFHATQGLDPHAVVFFGDMPEDAAAAADAGCVFVGVANEALKREDRPFIADFTGLEGRF
jgi:phosphoglycolate phosphatase-like HAD superfamily hydrolase